MLDGLRRLAEAVREAGLATRTLTLPAPTVALLSAPSNDELTDDLIFRKIIVEPEIYEVARDLFEGGFYSNAVQESFTALDNYVKEKCRKGKLSGVSLMRAAFAHKKPALFLNDGGSQSKLDEREGYEHMFAGSMLGIRNPTIHEYQWIEDREVALECLIVCQHLLRKAKSSTTSAP